MIWSYRTISGAPPAIEAGYTELELDPLTWDLALPVRVVRGPAAVTQRIRQRLSFFRGEYHLDQRLGVPYFRDVLGKGRTRARIETLLRRVITDTPGVRSLQSFDLVVDKVTRSASVNFEALLDDGDTIVRAVDAPLLPDITL